MSGGFWLLLIISVVGILLMLVVFGYLGPTRLRRSMRKFNEWYFANSEVLLPVHPYAPLGEDAIRDLPPLKRRAKQFLKLVSLILVSAILAAFFGLALLTFAGMR